MTYLSDSINQHSLSTSTHSRICYLSRTINERSRIYAFIAYRTLSTSAHAFTHLLPITHYQRTRAFAHLISTGISQYQRALTYLRICYLSHSINQHSQFAIYHTISISTQPFAHLLCDMLSINKNSAMLTSENCRCAHWQAETKNI